MSESICLCSETAVRVNALQVHCHVGAYDAERGLKQPVVIDIWCWQADPAVVADTIESAVNYSAAVRAVKALLAPPKEFVLLETMAEAIAGECFRLDARVARVRVHVRKPRKIEGCESAGVERSFERRAT